MRCTSSTIKKTIQPLSSTATIWAGILLATTLSGCSAPEAKSFAPPVKTGWQPSGVRDVGPQNNTIIPAATGFHTMHGDIQNTDNLWIAAAPMFQLDWVAEPAMYIPEGPTYDARGNVYFSPLNPAENVSLVSIDGTTGARRWAIEGDTYNTGGGAVLVLNDPQHPGEQLIYHATFSEAMAITTAGDIRWKKSTGTQLKGAVMPPHSFGMNYHALTDTVIGVTMDGQVFALDRTTGQAVASVFQLPGSPTPASGQMPSASIIAIGNRETDKVFGKLPDGSSLFASLINTIFGGGAQVSNYFGIAAGTGVIYIAATAPDGDDGQIDGVSQLGALYALTLTPTATGHEFHIRNYVTFDGGTGSTPTISADGSRVVESDGLGNVIVLDADLNEQWRLQVGAPIAASVAVSPDNREIYAVTAEHVIKIIDHGERGEIVWRATLDAFEGGVEFNALTPTITANGIVVSIGAGYKALGQQLMMKVGMGLLDRDTGHLRYFAEGREESISVSSVAPDGGFYIAHSPVRRAVTRGLLPRQVPPLTGGIARFKPVRQDLLVRDASCAAEARARNASTVIGTAPAAAAEEIAQIRILLQQAQGALLHAMADNEISETRAVQAQALLDASQAQSHTEALPALTGTLTQLCTMIE